ncbi:hypothetical protein EDM57_21045 [Brevibacillus gelatini]|uniref:Uncharacterized protein n=1 Tax=Brevibacillus gelatini TaxID=1655277 RepID=A0A3M8ANA9_9BACL|nr:hypothetical protein EDM57_21045 [Brevibacillus gelatini]
MKILLKLSLLLMRTINLWCIIFVQQIILMYNEIYFSPLLIVQFLLVALKQSNHLMLHMKDI